MSDYGGPPGARGFVKQGDQIPASARGQHPDYRDAELLVELKSWTCTGSTETEVLNGIAYCATEIEYPTGTEEQLQTSYDSPPAPMYRLTVSWDGNGLSSIGPVLGSRFQSGICTNPCHSVFNKEILDNRSESGPHYP